MLQPFVCCATLSVHRRAGDEGGDAILLVESGGWMLYSNVITKFCNYTFIHEVVFRSFFHHSCRSSVNKLCIYAKLAHQFLGITTRKRSDGAAFCLLCDIERTQESMREWRCDLARWEIESGGLSANKHQTLLFDAQNQTWQCLTMQVPRSWEKDKTTQLWVEPVSPRYEIWRIIGW